MNAQKLQGVAIETVALQRLIPSPEAIACLPEAAARRLAVVPLSYSTVGGIDCLMLASNDPDSPLVQERLRRQLPAGVDCRFMRAESTAIISALDKCYAPVLSDQLLLESCCDGEGVAKVSAAQADFMVRVVDALLLRACRLRASDIHVSPEPDCLRVRFRIDGVLTHFCALHASIAAAFLVRIKVMSQLDIAESRLPQDGQFTQWVDGGDVDFRVSTFPTVRGENLVLRVLNRQAQHDSLDSLCLPCEAQEVLSHAVHCPEGLIVVCGPTGCGKSTTLYAMLNELDSDSLNIMTLEDPVEFNRAGIRQTTLASSRSLDYSQGLRALLRQDPDVLLVGEIRDVQSCNIALRAVMTGHRVLTTVHANSVSGGLDRLVDLGGDAAMLAANLTLIVSQRLVRKLCSVCRGAQPACQQCQSTGYFGRQLIMEYLVITPMVAALIASRASGASLLEAAKLEGFVSLRDQAVQLLKKGITDQEEVERVLGSDSKPGGGVSLKQDCTDMRSVCEICSP